jgi:hypothetical protein
LSTREQGLWPSDCETGRSRPNGANSLTRDTAPRRASAALSPLKQKETVMAVPDGFHFTGLSSPPVNPQLRAIALDAAGAAVYSCLAVAADPDAPTSGALEASFRSIVDGAPADRREDIRQRARALLDVPPETRKMLYGRAGTRSPREHLAVGGMEKFNEGLPALEFDEKLLGLPSRNVTLSVPPSAIEADEERLIVTAPIALRDVAALQGEVASRRDEAIQTGILDREKFLSAFAPPAGIPFSPDGLTFTAELGELQHNAVRFRIHRIRCSDQTNGWAGGETFADKIDFAAITIGPSGEQKKIGRERIGSFRDNESRVFSPPRELGVFPADVGAWPWYSHVVLILAERDLRGFAEYLDELYDKVRDDIADKVKEWVVQGLEVILGTLLASVVGGLVAFAINWVLEKLLGLIKDDIFEPRTVAGSIESDKALRHASDVLDGFEQPTQVAHFYGFKGHYEIYYSWALEGRVAS